MDTEGGRRQTDGCDEVDDDEGVQHGDDGSADGRNDVAQALEASKEPEDSESSKHLRRIGQDRKGNLGINLG
jgi:hypothetical protein